MKRQTQMVLSWLDEELEFRETALASRSLGKGFLRIKYARDRAMLKAIKSLVGKRESGRKA